MTHYYKPGRPGRKKLISLVIRGQTLEFQTYTSLFSGSEIDEGTRLLLEYAEIPRSGVVLDLGCGYGVIGITIAKLNPKLKVYMTDINPLAVKAAKYNARLNGVEDRVVILQGNLYEPVKDKLFDAIYSNPPLSAGKKIVEEIIIDAKQHLKPDRHAEFVLARGHEYYTQKARENYSIVKTRRKKGYILLYLKP